MDAKLEILDDVVPASLARSIADLLGQPIWKFGHQSNGSRDRFSFWSTKFAGGDGNSRVSCLGELSKSEAFAPILGLWEMLERTLLVGHEPLRVYANAHTYGSEGYVHVDNQDTENYFSTIYYAHPTWLANWAGDLAFYDVERCDTVASIFPKPGRVVSFPGYIPHCVRAPSRDCPEIRLSLVFKSQVAHA